MNFYSDEIINNIIDNQPLDQIIEKVEDFIIQCKSIAIKYSSGDIHPEYTKNVLRDPEKTVAFHCLDNNEFSIDNCPAILVYRKVIYPDEIIYYVLFTCTKRSFRGQGYASRLFDGFIQRVKSEKMNRGINGIPKKARIVLSSLETSVIFYESYGFKWTRESISKYPLLLEYEIYEKNKEYFILQLDYKQLDNK